jgi:hypothetical protein
MRNFIKSKKKWNLFISVKSRSYLKERLFIIGYFDIHKGYLEPVHASLLLLSKQEWFF